MNRFSRRKDDNHREIVKMLKMYGVSVEDTSSVGCNCADIFAAWQGRTIRVEIKNEKTRGKMSDGQSEAFLLWRGEKTVAYNAKEILIKLGVIK